MLWEWFNLRKTSVEIPGNKKITLMMIYLWLAIRYPQRNNAKRLTVSKLSGSLVRDNLNQWLRFQVNFIHEKRWAGTPIIKAVTLVNTHTFDDQDLNKLSIATKQNIESTVTRFMNSFEDLQEQDLRNWLIRNYLLCDAFSEKITNPIDDEGVLVEIGPGLGGVLAQAQGLKLRKIYSLDTIEMQAIFSAIKHPVTSNPNHIINIPVNVDLQFSGVTEDKINNIIAFWSFTELKAEDRMPYLKMFTKADRILIACNQQFEGINNFEYLENLSKQLQMKLSKKALPDIFHTKLPSYQKNHRMYLLEK
jgi:hypothetical protein